MIRKTLLLILGFVASQVLYATPFGVGHYLTSKQLESGSHDIVELDNAGTVIQTLTPQVTGRIQSIRGMDLDQYGRLHVIVESYDGDIHYGVKIYDPVTATWSGSMSAPGLSAPNVAQAGQLACYQGYDFVTDSFTSSPDPSGLVRFNTSDGSYVRLQTSVEPIDVTVGLDGNVYTLEGEGSPAGRQIRGVNPLNFGSVFFSSLPQSIVNDPNGNVSRNIAVDAAGNIYLAHWNVLYKLSPTMNVLASASVNLGQLEFDHATGNLISYSTDGIRVFDQNLHQLRFISTNWGYQINGNFGAYVAVPEPSSTVALLLGLSLFAMRKVLHRGRSSVEPC